MKVKVLSILAAFTLFAACENPFVSNILPDRGAAYTVTFDKNGGTTEASPRTKTVTPPATNVGALPAPPMRTNYTFAGWNTRADGGGSAFTASTAVTANITVYAKWTPGGPSASVKVDFENDSIGKTYESTGGYDANDQPVSPTVRVVADPANAGQKSLEISSTGYNQAAIIPISLPAWKTLSDAESFSFRIRLTSGTISYKEVQVYAAGSSATFEHGGFVNPANSEYAQFAANKLGETATIPELALNQWKDYTINISGLNSAISNLSGTIYLAIGIQHDTSEAITYLLDDLTFTFAGGQPSADFPTLVTFEGDAINKAYEFTSGDNSPDSVAVAADPANTSQKSLKVVTNASGGKSAWNQAAVIPIRLTDPLSAYKSFRFRFNLQTAGTLLDNGAPRKINVYVADATSKFARYAFGNPSSSGNQFVNLLVGEIAPDYGETGHWVEYAVNFTSPGDDIKNLSGNVYVAVGINHDTAVTYYLDDLTFSKQELQKQPGAALAGTLAVTNVTHKSADIDDSDLTAPATGQDIEYSVSSTGAAGVWQASTSFTGLTSETSYTAYARSAANALYNAGAAISSAPFTTLGKKDGAAVTGTISITPANIKHNSVTLTVSSLALDSATGQTIEYAIALTNSAPSSGWQTVTTFSGLKPFTDYYVFARSKANDDYKAGAPTNSVTFKTLDVQLNPNVPPVVVDFESDSVGSTTKYTVTPGNGNGTVTIVNDPLNAGQKSLSMHSTDYNRGAIIPINLPFALQNYQSFTFRFRKVSGTPSNPQVSVYIADATSKFVNYGFGNPANHNPSNQQFANLLLGEVEPNFSAAEWVEYEIEIDANTLNSAIKTLSGNLYLAIGINSSGAIELQFDDLTFNVKHDMATPAPSITPATATFAKDSPADISVNINLYLVSIKNGATNLTENSDYTIGNQGSTVTLKKEYFNGMTASSTPVTLTFTFKSGGTGSIAITVVDTIPSYGGTWYDFTKATTTTTPTGISTSSNMTVTVKEQDNVSVLEVDRPGGYGDPGQLMIPFDLGSTNLNTFTKLVLIARCSRGTDFTNKNVTVAVLNSDGTTWTNLRTQSTSNNVAPNEWTSSFKTIEIGPFSGTPSRTGPITIRIQWDQSTSLAYQFQYIGLGN